MKIQLILISFLALFLELALIRWLLDNVMSLAYFSNIVLISSFLGLGLGFILASKKQDLFNYFPIVLLCVITLSIFLRYIETVVPNLGNELMWSYYTGNGISTGPIHLDILSALSVVFFLNAAPFVLIGQKTARLMKEFRPLVAYGLDISGAILGIIAFSALSFIGGPFGTPLVWFLAAGCISVWFLRGHTRHMAIGAVCILALAPILYSVSKNELWSPYYAVQTVKGSEHTINVFVNRFFFQRMIDFNLNLDAKAKYGLPYTLKTPQEVLILGAGSGNDAAIAKMNNVPHIDAVELDPVIADLGKRLHPNYPYWDPNVTLYIDDARSFLKKTDKKYDMIILGTLDSHALLSGKSTVRLDNFVYTAESFQEIKKHLNADGVVVLMFSTPVQWLADKIVASVRAVFDTPAPLAYVGSPELFNLMIVAGPGVATILHDHPLGTTPFIQATGNYFNSKNISTDNWPYLYLREHTISSYYLKGIGILLAISLIGVLLLFRGRKSILIRWSSLNFFCLGAAFLLLETKSITTLSLLFGSTWLVNAFVFGGILTMVLLANIAVSRVPIPRIGAAYVLLGLSLVINYLLPTSAFLGLDFWTRSILSALFIALPIFFASIIFSFHFKSITDISTLYGLNLMGAVFGGFLEYSSMMTGLNFLYVIAGIMYAVSYASSWMTSQSRLIAESTFHDRP